MYTIGQISKLFGIPISTLRYYDKEGLFPDLERQSGRRLFSEKEVEALRVIECLKTSGLEIKDIRLFMKWAEEGSATYPQRRHLLEARKAAVEEEMHRLQTALDMLRYKCWYYDTALRDGDEERLQSMLPDKLPVEIQQLYDRVHKK